MARSKPLKKNPVATSGGRYLRIDVVCQAKKKKKSVELEPKRDPSQPRVAGKASELNNGGLRTSRISYLEAAERVAKGRVNATPRNSSEKSLQAFGRGATKGKQKTRGVSKPPVAHAKTSQAHIEVFYSASKIKFDVPPPAIHPLKTCRIVPRNAN